MDTTKYIEEGLKEFTMSVSREGGVSHKLPGLFRRDGINTPESTSPSSGSDQEDHTLQRQIRQEQVVK